MAAPKMLRCPHCNAKLRISRKTNLSGKRLGCPKCSKTIVLKARSSPKQQETYTVGKQASSPRPEKDDGAAADQSSPDTQSNINELSQTDSQLRASAESEQTPPTASQDALLKGLSEELVSLDEQAIDEERPRRHRDDEDEDDGGGLYRLCGEGQASSASPRPLDFEEEDDKAWGGAFDESADDAAAHTDPVVEATPDELNLMEALEGLAEQAKSRPKSRRKKTTKGPKRNRKHP